MRDDRHLLGLAIRPEPGSPFVVAGGPAWVERGWDGELAVYPYGRGWVPHLLVIGGPGSGKSTFARSLLLDMVRTANQTPEVDRPLIGAADGKESDAFLMFAGQPGIAGISNTSKRTAEMALAWCEDMRARYALLSKAKREKFATGRRPAWYKAPPSSFLVIDEFIPWALSLPDKERAEVFESLKWGALAAREARGYLRILTQVPYADKSGDGGLPSKVKSVLDARIAMLGHAGLRPMEARMAFGDDQSKASDRIEEIADLAAMFGDTRRGLGMLQIGTKEVAFKGLWTPDLLDPDVGEADEQIVLKALPIRPRPEMLEGAA